MKKINAKSKLIIFIAFVALAAVGLVWNMRHTKAQTTEPPSVVDRISFGMVGITQGQTARLNVSNIVLPNEPNLPPGPIRVALTFRDSEGRLFRNRDGVVIRRVVVLEPGKSTFLDLNFDELSSGPVRLQLRAAVTVVQPTNESNQQPINPCVPTLEVVNNATGRTTVSISNPAQIRSFNPQPDPPLEQ